MRNERLMEKLDEIERYLDEMDREKRVLGFCIDNEIDYGDASEYADAVISLTRAEREEKECVDDVISNNNAQHLLFGKSVESESLEDYNHLEAKIDTINSKLARVSDYSFLDRIYKGIRKTAKRARQKITGRIVRNKTGVRIAIAGETRERPGAASSAWLYPGQDSNRLFEDVDAVVIARGQKFFKSLSDMKAKRKDAVVTTGAIKIPDSLTVAEIEHARGMEDVFYVNAHGTRYYAGGGGWRTP